MSCEREELGGPIFPKHSLHRDTHWGSIPATIAGCPISACFWQMWDTAGLPLKSVAGRQICTGAPCSHQRCPDFLLRRTSHDHACGFPQRMPHEGAQRQQLRQEIRDTWAENDGRSPSKAFRFGPCRLFISTGTKQSEVKELPFFSPGTHTHAVGKHLRRRAALAAEGAASCRD
jgi:hypothetical protein